MENGMLECDLENVPCAPSVQPIDHKSVHQICSGQVILNLATAVKELVENALDAGAKIIEVKLKENGADLVEVIDNGCGVKPESFTALTLKHYTSKLRDFSDLSSVETFGFRGEALSSLCALSDLCITTRHNSEKVGTRIEYDHNGKILSRTPCAREHGTTVVLHNLFATLPVRHKEFVRNLKKEYVKLLQVLHAYCIISSGVRLSCSNQFDKGKRSLLVATNGSFSLKENISCVFGPKQTQNLLQFHQVEPSEDECETYGVQQDEIRNKTTIFQISGYVSKAEHGMGRSSTDRQFFYINKRPCDFIKVSRVVNEVYHMYNRHQYPFVVLDISLARDSVDVNVTPDKRQVFVQEEKLLLAIIKSSLKKMLEPGSSTYDVNQGLQSQSKLASLNSSVQNLRQQGENWKGRYSPVVENKQDSTGIGKRVFPSLTSFKRKCGLSDVVCDIKGSEPQAKQAKLTAVFRPATHVECENSSQQLQDSSGQHDPNTRCIVSAENESETSKIDQGDLQNKGNAQANTLGINGPKSNFKANNEKIVLKECDEKNAPSKTRNMFARVSEFRTVAQRVGKTENDQEIDIRSESEVGYDSKSCSVLESEKGNHRTKCGKHYRNLVEILATRKSVDIDFNLNEIRETCKPNFRQSDTNTKNARLFRAKISPESNQVAEQELKKHVSKEMFDNMEILGQFNLGFIITKLKDDLFLIDQHASDEKYNFEDLKRNSELKSQKLIQPLQLELTAVNESILLENLEIFRKNGFDFEIDENAAPMKKVKVASLPMSKNWTFGVEDIEELIFMLSDSPGIMCRPSRVRKMFASRACRMSIMVGTALDHRKMKRVVGHMGQMDQPWNCPHGRPTMRHLINLRMISSPD